MNSDNPFDKALYGYSKSVGSTAGSTSDHNTAAEPITAADKRIADEAAAASFMAGGFNLGGAVDVRGGSVPSAFAFDTSTSADSIPAGRELLDQLLVEAMEAVASDVHITVALPPMMRVNGQLKPMRDYKLTPEQTAKICHSMLNEKQREILEEKGEVDFSYGIPNVSRFRVNVYRQRKSLTAAIRIIVTNIPTLESLGFPPIMQELAMKPRGLILVTGPTGSGKSTTLAAMVDYVNSTVDRHILTLEEPIEYLHKHKKSMVNQREVGDDSQSFASGLRAALREDPDVILVGEMRDLETISTAISAAETGHLVMSTLHTTSAPQTIDRIIDVFPPYQQTQIRVQLASVLQGIIAQQLLITADGKGRVAALEILLGTDAVRNTIREGKIHQVNSYIQTGQKYGMMSMDYSLAQLVKTAKISTESAFSYCQDRDMLQRYLVSEAKLF